MKTLIKIEGNCLEGLGITHPSYAIIDDEITPVIGDIVHCRKYMCSLNSYIKQVYNYYPLTKKYTVGTVYNEPEQNFYFNTKIIHGTVLTIFDADGVCLYERK